MDNDAMDRLPEGMRVLAVDNNPICLKTMELTLRQCHYQVTTANHASEAMKILRANRNMFDLVISDLKMPDMDGFHLLQLLGNEMVDLPVVLVSTDGDTELIKKGISYGACCCLKKPVAVEVLKTIWQHVFRRKKLMNPKDQYYCKSPYQFEEDEQEVISSTCSSEQNLKGKRKRKEQQTRYDEDEYEDMKLPRKNHRMDWTPELHDKFVDAYNFLERTRKSSPKEILELMNVEGLTRRHVASHLQKFRVHLREGKVSYRRCRDLDPWRKHVHSSSGLSYTPPHMLCSSTNSSAAPFSYSRMAQPSQNLCNSLNYVANPQPSVVTHESSMIGVNGQSMSNNGASTTNFPFMRLPESSICYDNCGTLTSRGNPQVVGNQACLNSLYRESSFDNGICTSQVVDYNGHGVVHIHNPQGQNMDQSDVVCNTSLNSSPFEQPSGSNTTIVLENCNMHTKNDPDKDFILLEQSKLDYTVTVPDNVFESQNDQERDELKDYDILIDLGFDVDALREQVQ